MRLPRRQAEPYHNARALGDEVQRRPDRLRAAAHVGRAAAGGAGRGGQALPFVAHGQHRAGPGVGVAGLQLDLDAADAGVLERVGDRLLQPAEDLQHRARRIVGQLGLAVAALVMTRRRGARG